MTEPPAGRASSGRTRPPPDPRGAVAARLEWLFDVIRTPSGKPFSAAAVERWISDHGGRVTADYILKIRTGERAPSDTVVRELARFFSVPPAVLLDDDPPEVDVDHARALVALRDERIWQLVSGFALLSQGSQTAILDLVNHLVHAERGGRPASS